MDKGRPKMMPRPNVAIQSRLRDQTAWAAAIASIGADLMGFLKYLGRGEGGRGAVHIFGATQGNYHITPDEAASQVRKVECVQPRPWRSWQHYWRRASSVNRSSRRSLRRKYEAAVQRSNASS